MTVLMHLVWVFVPPAEVKAIVLFGETVTLPNILLEVQPPAFLTVNVYEIVLPLAGLLKLTVMGVAGKVPSVTVVMPTPDIE